MKKKWFLKNASPHGEKKIIDGLSFNKETAANNECFNPYCRFKSN